MKRLIDTLKSSYETNQKKKNKKFKKQYKKDTIIGLKDIIKNIKINAKYGYYEIYNYTIYAVIYGRFLRRYHGINFKIDGEFSDFLKWNHGKITYYWDKDEK